MITGATNEEVVELYRRLQGGSVLSFGEKLYSYVGRMNDFIKGKVVSKNFFKKTISLTDARYSHYAVAAQLCLLSIRGAVENLKLKNLEDFFKAYPGFDPGGLDAKKVFFVFKFLEKAFSGSKDPALRNRANIVSAFYLASDLSSKGNILGREGEFGKFFKGFIKELYKEFEKDPDKRDPELISYQSAVTQGADKIKSVKIRHAILLKRIGLKSKFFKELLHPKISPEDQFKNKYDEFASKKGFGTVGSFDSWLISTKKTKEYICAASRGKTETYVGHIRNCITHPGHGKYTLPSLSKGIKLLENLLKK
jgi:hypothetical protein